MEQATLLVGNQGKRTGLYFDWTCVVNLAAEGFEILKIENTFDI